MSGISARRAFIGGSASAVRGAGPLRRSGREASVLLMNPTVFDLTRSERAAGAGALEASIELADAQPRLHLRLPTGEAGRAEAVFRGRSWAAKHYWREAPDLMVYEFDEPLPAGPVTVRVPFARTER